MFDNDSSNALDIVYDRLSNALDIVYGTDLRSLILNKLRHLGVYFLQNYGIK
jgi:hypothetical protein